MKYVITAGLSLATSLSVAAGAGENHADAIVSQILDTQQAIMDLSENPENLVFLAFWDFDGTILKGDCSEGLTEAGNVVYAGLVRLAIENGYSGFYKPDGGFERFWEDYTHLDERFGGWLAYPFIPQVLRGSKACDVSDLAAAHFDEVLRHYYFRSSIRMLKALEQNGIENHVISASADLLVDASAATTGLPVERLNGIELAIEDGRVTERIIYPVTWADGKTEKLISIVEETRRKNPGKQPFVLAAFGNSYTTDGPFMKYVATRTLPAGKTTVVMINGGDAPESYRDVFLQVQQRDLER